MVFVLAALLLVINFLSCTALNKLNTENIYPQEEAQITPLLARIDNIPQAFYGSDNKYHIAYEIIFIVIIIFQTAS